MGGFCSVWGRTCSLRALLLCARASSVFASFFCVRELLHRRGAEGQGRPPTREGPPQEDRENIRPKGRKRNPGVWPRVWILALRLGTMLEHVWGSPLYQKSGGFVPRTHDVFRFLTCVIPVSGSGFRIQMFLIRLLGPRV